MHWFRLSGNYRRAGHRDKETGKILWASSADLKPVLERLEEFQAIAATAKEAKSKKQILNKKIGSLRREVRSLITLHCPELLEQFVHVLDIRSRLTWAYDRLETLWQHLQDIWQEIEAYLEESAETPENSENDHENRSHGCGLPRPLYKATIQDKSSFVEPMAHDEVREDTPRTDCLPPDEGKKKIGSIGVPVTLGMVSNMIASNSEGMMQHAMYGLPTNFSSIVEAAHRSCKMLGISEDAWKEACQIMGIETAALAVASIDAKGKRVENPGGYLRGMSRKHANGKMKLSKTIRGLVHQSSVS